MTAASINLTNQFLIAMPGMGGGMFAGTVVYLCEHTEKGALGLVINKPIDITLKSLFEKVELSLDRDDLAELPVYFGGPVQTERGFVLHEPIPAEGREGGPYNSSLKIEGGLEMTTSKDVLEAISSRRRPEEGARHARLQRLGRRPARGRDEQERLDQRRMPSPASSSTRPSVSATTRRSRCSASTSACSARTRGTREPPERPRGQCPSAQRAGCLMLRAVAPPALTPLSYLAFDFGTRRVGVATRQLAHRHGDAADHDRGRGRGAPGRDRLRSSPSGRPAALVVGVPFHPDGAAHVNTERARRFARELRARFGLPVHEVDERYTTTAAKQRAAGADLDAAAAAIILEQFLASASSTTAPERAR